MSLYVQGVYFFTVEHYSHYTSHNEKFNINYSKKNISTTSIAQYKRMLISKIEKVIMRMRRKVLVIVTKTKHTDLDLWNVHPQLKKWRSLKMIYCYWLRTSNLRRYIVAFRQGCVMTSKRLKPVTRSLFQPINRDIFTKWKKINTRNCYETTSLKRIKNWKEKS